MTATIFLSDGVTRSELGNIARGFGCDRLLIFIAVFAFRTLAELGGERNLVRVFNSTKGERLVTSPYGEANRLPMSQMGSTTALMALPSDFRSTSKLGH